MTISVRLTKIDRLLLNDHRFLGEEDDCGFLSEYTARKGYNYSNTNGKILNLKISKDDLGKNQNRRQYKNAAILYWAQLLKTAVSRNRQSNSVWLPIPPSSPKSSPNYDDRLLRVLRNAYGQNCSIADIIVQNDNRDSSHGAGMRPTPDDYARFWRLENYNINNDLEVIIFDDVITRGASFKAAKNLVKERFPDINVIGVFLARTVHEDDENLGFDFLQPE